MAASDEGNKIPIMKQESSSSSEGDNKMLSEAAASEEGKILKHESSSSSEGDNTILKLDSLILEPEEDDRPAKVLTPDSEEDRKILMKVKSEEGKILKLKKEYMAASDVGLARFSAYIEPRLLKLVEPSGKKKKVFKTLVPPSYIALIKAMPCPVTSRVLNTPPSFDDTEDEILMRESYEAVHIKMRDYHQALVDQYEKFGCAVDETELTDDEDEENNMVEN